MLDTQIWMWMMKTYLLQCHTHTREISTYSHRCKLDRSKKRGTPCCVCSFWTQNFASRPVSVRPSLASAGVGPVSKGGPLSVSRADVERNLIG